ncbi:MAG TPA: hypothetical protein VD907_04295 [Verrucomicrobiae bacterium]|nr:hypothetical protein [Verrucomicrobiae bacterium]
MDPKQTTSPPTNNPAPQPIYKKSWFIIAIVVAVLLFAVWALVTFMNQSSKGSNQHNIFYKMIEAAAQQTKVRYAYELTVPERSDFPAVSVRSLAEYDAAKREYSLVAVSDSLSPRAYRCVKNTPLESTTIKSPASRAEAETAITGPWKPATSGIALDSCDYTRSRYHGSTSDGILPVGLTAQQASTMAQALTDEKDGIITRNEGAATYKGKTGKKVSFEVGQEKTGKPVKADTFFYAFRDGNSSSQGGNGIQAEDIPHHFEQRFFLTSPLTGLKGYYIIDENTNLPIYSEIHTTADGIASEFSPTTLKSTYEYPAELTMTDRTALPRL